MKGKVVLVEMPDPARSVGRASADEVSRAGYFRSCERIADEAGGPRASTSTATPKRGWGVGLGRLIDPDRARPRRRSARAACRSR